MKAETVKEFKVSEFVLISSLPDMGKVGGLVSQHIAEKLDAQVSSKIMISDKPWVNQKRGLISVPHDEYRLLVDEKNKIVIFAGESQPQEPCTVMRLAELVFEEARKIGRIKKIISAGGYLPAQQGEGAEVFGVATSQKTLDELQENGVSPLTSDVSSITWFNGLILGRAKDNGIDGIGLFGEIADSNTPQYRAASNVVRKIGQILKTAIETRELDGKIAEPRMQAKPDNPGIG